MADVRLSSKEDGQSSVEAKRCSKETGPSFKAAKRSSNEAFDDVARHAEADVSASIPNPRGGASERNCGSRPAPRTRSEGGPDPSGGAGRKRSGGIVPETETPGPSGPGSAGAATVPR